MGLYTDAHFLHNQAVEAKMKAYFPGKEYETDFKFRSTNQEFHAKVKITSVKSRGNYYHEMICYASLLSLTKVDGSPANISHLSKTNLPILSSDIAYTIGKKVTVVMNANFDKYDSGPNSHPRLQDWYCSVQLRIPPSIIGTPDEGAEASKIQKVFEGKKFKITYDENVMDVSIKKATFTNGKIHLVIEMPKDSKVNTKKIDDLKQVFDQAFQKLLKYINREGMGFSYDLIGRFYIE